MVTDAEGRILEFDLSGPNSVVNINEKTGENTIDLDRVVLASRPEDAPVGHN